MRLIKPNPKDLNKLIRDAAQELMRGESKVTLSIDTLLKLPEPKAKDKPTVRISEEANLKMKALVAASDKEIAWHGVVERTKPLEFHIKDILVYPQIVTGSTVESCDDSYPLWLDELTDDTYNNIRMQGHSHVNMPVFASGTDSDFYETLTKHIKDFYIFMILNKSGKVYMELRDIKNNILYDTDDINIQYSGKDYSGWAKEQLESFITTKTYVHYTKRNATKKSKSKSKNKYNKIKTIPQDDETQYDSLEYDYEDEEWEDYFNYINFMKTRGIL